MGSLNPNIPQVDSEDIHRANVLPAKQKSIIDRATLDILVNCELLVSLKRFDSHQCLPISEPLLLWHYR